MARPVGTSTVRRYSVFTPAASAPTQCGCGAVRSHGADDGGGSDTRGADRLVRTLAARIRFEAPAEDCFAFFRRLGDYAVRSRFNDPTTATTQCSTSVTSRPYERCDCPPAVSALRGLGFEFGHIAWTTPSAHDSLTSP